jgi:GT2 family glycosyltransferase
MKYSFIIPVYNRPDEVDELLQSLVAQTVDDFEVIVVEDGSSVPCRDVCERYAGKMPIHYFMKENSGPAKSRNYGATLAQGEFLIILDSDVVLPTTYLEAVSHELEREPADAFGGPDRANSSFSRIQKAISYSMTSFFTTGGIRGGKKKLDKFYPRSYNMGIRRDAFNEIGGFSDMRFGEDIDFSIRIFQGGYRCRLFPGAWVWHKRRTDFVKFLRQVYNSGIARINLYKRHPESLKIVHLLPMVFTVGVMALILLSFSLLSLWPLLPLLLYALIILVDSAVKNHSIVIGFLSIIAAYVQLIGYGLGFIDAWWRRIVLKQDEFQAFSKTFYK